MIASIDRLIKVIIIAMDLNKKNVNYVIRLIEESDFNQILNKVWPILDFTGDIYENQVMMKVDQGTFVAQNITSGNILLNISQLKILYQGELLGICSGINISTDMAMIGQYGVLPAYRGIGIGTALWHKVMEHIGGERNISLYAMDHMFDKYVTKSNFKYFAEKRANRYAGKPDCSQLIKEMEGISVVPISKDNIEKVIQYDKEICDGLDRTVLIEEVSKIGQYVNRVALNLRGDVLGYCVVKVSNLNTGIVEPLYANDEKIAELLIAKCFQSLDIIGTNGVVFPTWSINHRVVAIAKKMGLQVVRSTAILFTKKIVEGNMDRIYCISNRCFYPF